MTHTPPRIGALEPRHRERVAALLQATGVFRAAEVDVALELFDETFTGARAEAPVAPVNERSARDAGPGDSYQFFGAFTPDDELAGYVCFGATPATDRTIDLYWLAVDPAQQWAGVGTRLVSGLLRQLADARARVVVVETSSRSEYAAARALYERLHFVQAARVRDYYAPGDDRIIYTKRLNRPAGGEQGHHE